MLTCLGIAMFAQPGDGSGRGCFCMIPHALARRVVSGLIQGQKQKILFPYRHSIRAIGIRCDVERA